MDLQFAIEMAIDNVVLEEWHMSTFFELVLKAVVKDEKFDKELWKALQAILPATDIAKLEEAYDSGGKDAFEDCVGKVLKKLPRELMSAGTGRLKNLSSMLIKSPLANQLRSLQSVPGLLSKLNLDDEDRLRVAFAYSLAALINTAADRAARIPELSVGEASSMEADSYLEEACYCYFYQLDTACAITCRSVLEEVIERKLPHRVLDEWREKKGQSTNREPTLGDLVQLSKTARRNNEWRLPKTAYDPLDEVKKIGNRAAHRQPVSGADALKCLTAARNALAIILG